MSQSNPIFHSNQRCDLGTEDYTGMSKLDVDESLQRTYYDTSRRCIICGGRPQYQLIAKVPELNTEQLRKEGIVCSNCVNQKRVDPNTYALKELR